jgi:phosphoglycerate dehydrogenase-like enzyme
VSDSNRLFLIWMYAPGYPLWSMPEATVERIRDALGKDWEVRSVLEPQHASGDGTSTVPPRILEEIAEAEVYCGWGIPREAFQAGRQLRWVHTGAAGVGGSLHEEMRASDVEFTNSAGVYAEPMAEHALAMILHFARGLDVATSGQRDREWTHPRLAGEGGPVREIAGRTLGIVGYGGIGKALARKASALGMWVRAIRRTPGALPPESLPAELEALTGPEGLSDLLAASDYVVLAVPETPETTQLIGRKELEPMREGTVLINLARGGLVDESALTDALLERRLRGAGLDVFGREPLDPDSLLWELENVLITPHVSGMSERFWERETELVIENIRRYLAGRKLVNRVDKQRGY